MENVLFFVFIPTFLAELGDKIQLTTIAFASKYGWKTAFLGLILGLAAVNLVGALISQELGDLDIAWKTLGGGCHGQEMVNGID